ncbi:NlpC/P60 family protein [Deinococcus lacus]|uniref:NlpC/P60 family protein n=1 Tax=Deinococcus lacus TaxID=392561 RepID=A0ABW1YAU9_9DEIO
MLTSSRLTFLRLFPVQTFCAPARLFLACTALLGPPALAGETAPAEPAALTAADPGVLAAHGTVTVMRGDTAYSLARTHGLSVPELLELNNLESHDLEVGQVLRVRVTPPHTVVKGDTVYSLSRTYGLTVEALLSANDLDAGATIHVGQLLAIPAPTISRPVRSSLSVAAQAPATQGFSATPADTAWKRNALALLDTPYVYGGTTARGIDCSGLVLQVFAPLGYQLPRTSAAQAQVGRPVSRTELLAGDLVFFDTVGRGAVTHVGIYLGDDQFVNANSYYGRVVIDKLNADRYWAPRYLGARRILAENDLVARGK